MDKDRKKHLSLGLVVVEHYFFYEEHKENSIQSTYNPLYSDGFSHTY